MVNHISVLGWVLIIFTVLLIISLFVSLFSRSKGKGRNANWINALKKAGDTLRDPFAGENRKMQELSEKVASIKQTTLSNHQHNNGNHETGVKNEH